MKHFDAIIIGGGILGCMTARNLRRWNISTLLLEKEGDICTGITRANSAIVYPGYDNKPGTRKAEMTVRGCENMESLCRELDVPFSRCGSLMVAYSRKAAQVLEKKLQRGAKNGVVGLEILSGSEAEQLEPMLRKGVVSALYCPSTGTVNPWLLGIAAWENAEKNGAKLQKNTTVLEVLPQEDGYLVKTEKESVFCKMVFNCAGLQADTFCSSVMLEQDSAEYLVFDKLAETPTRVIFLEGEEGKGITAVPTTQGNLLVESRALPMHLPFETTTEGLEALHRETKDLLPGMELKKVIRSFGAVRPNPHRTDGSSIPDFCIEHTAPGFYSLVGIKTPGVTCANELGLYLAQEAAAYLGAEENQSFDPLRKAIPKADGEIICHCEGITREEILEAIRRGATTVKGVKYRVGAGMGRCQGSRCSFEVQKLLEEYGHGKI